MEKSILLEFFGDAPLFRVIDFLLENRGLDYSKTEIAKGADIGWSTLFKIWDRLEENNLVTNTRTYGNTKLFKLNLKNGVVQHLMKIELDLIKQSSKDIGKEVILAKT